MDETKFDELLIDKKLLFDRMIDSSKEEVNLPNNFASSNFNNFKMIVQQITDEIMDKYRKILNSRFRINRNFK